jgi:hypothetical protein
MINYSFFLKIIFEGVAMNRYTLSERAEYLEKYSRHRGTLKSFCESEGLKSGTLQYWLKESRKRESPPDFVELFSSKALPSKDPQYIEITTRSGTTMRIPL